MSRTCILLETILPGIDVILGIDAIDSLGGVTIHAGTANFNVQNFEYSNVGFKKSMSCFKARCFKAAFFALKQPIKKALL